MKYFYLLHSSFRQFLQSKPFLFCVLLVGVIISFFSFHTLLGTANYVIDMETRNFYRTFTLDLREATDPAVWEALDDLEEEKWVDSLLFMNIRGDNLLLVGMRVEDSRHWFAQSEGRYFTEEEQNSGANVAVVSSSMYAKADFDWRTHPFPLDDKELNVVGFCEAGAPSSLFTEYELKEKFLDENTSPYQFQEPSFQGSNSAWRIDSQSVCMIPLTTYRQWGYTPDVLRVECTLSEYDKLPQVQSWLEQHFPTAEIIPPGRPEALMTDELWNTAFQAILATCLALINIVSLFAYWLWMNRQTYRVYAICGAKRSRVFGILVGQWACIVLVGWGLARLLQWLVQPALEGLNISMRVSLIQMLSIILGGYLITLIILAGSIYRACQSGRNFSDRRRWN